MATSEILFWALLVLAWGLSLMVAYYQGRADAWRAASRMAHEMVSQKLDELMKEPPIR